MSDFGPKFKSIYKAFKSFFIMFLITFLLLEVLLHIYNPIPIRIKGNEIILPINKSFIFSNDHIDKLDKKIYHKKNSIGFRGKEPLKDVDTPLSIITVGGSTTECYFLSDGKTWPDQLGKKLENDFSSVWVNNAGLDGHSTFGHQILLNDYLVNIKPKAIIFLVGLNDLYRSDLVGVVGRDLNLTKDEYIDLQDWIKKNSEVANLIINLFRGLKASKRDLGDYKRDWALGKFKKLETHTSIEDLKKEHEQTLLDYEKRVVGLINTCKQNRIIPIILTQPLLWGEGEDDQTKINLETLEYLDGISSKTHWNTLELYNDITRKVCNEYDAHIIDLAKKLPKSSLYYYDECHYTNEGSSKIADILYEDLRIYFRNEGFN